MGDNPPLMQIRVLRLRAVHGSGGGSGFVVCSVGLLVGCAAGFVRWWGRGADLRDRGCGGRLVKLLRSEDMTVWLCLVPVAPVV